MSGHRGQAGWKNAVVPDLVLLVSCGAVSIWDGVRIITTKQDSFDATMSGAWVCLLGGALIALSIVYAARSVLANEAKPVDASSAASTASWMENWRDLRTGLFALVLLATFAILLTRAGYLVCTASFTMAYVGRFGRYRWWTVIVGSLAFAISTAYLFAWMRVELPRGLVPWP